MHDLEQITILAVVAVVIIGFVSHFSGKLGVAAPLALVVVGVVLGVIPGTPEIELEPELVLGVVLPPLLYAAALQVPFVEFRRNLRVIVSLSVVLVGVSALATGFVVHWLMPPVALSLAIALGAVVAPPDAVAAISLGRRLGLPPRIVTILEGEGLVNDATALVLLSTALSVATADAAVGGWSVLGTFLWAVACAVVVGGAIGIIAVHLRARVRDTVLDTAVSLVVPFVAFIIAEQLGGSGVVAVVVAGIVVGNKGAFRVPATHRRAERGNWSTFTMLVENGVFLLMGYLLPPVVAAVAARGELGPVIGLGALVTLLLIGIRFAWMPLLLWQMRRHASRLESRQSKLDERMALADERFGDDDDERVRSRLDRWRGRVDRSQQDVTAERDQALCWRDGVVLGMAGMRGVVTIAAAQTLPATHPHYESLVLLAFVVAIATLLPQGLLLPRVVRALRLQRDDDSEERAQFGRLMLRLHEAGAAAIDHAAIAAGSDESVAEELRDRLAERDRRAHELADHGGMPEARARSFHAMRRAEIDAEREALARERRRGAYSSEAIAAAQRLLDDHEIQLEQRFGRG